MVEASRRFDRLDLQLQIGVERLESQTELVAETAREVAQDRRIRIARFDGGAQLDAVVGVETQDDHAVHRLVVAEDHVQDRQQAQTRRACARIVAHHYETQITGYVAGARQFFHMLVTRVATGPNDLAQVIWAPMERFDNLHENRMDCNPLVFPVTTIDNRLKINEILIKWL